MKLLSNYLLFGRFEVMNKKIVIAIHCIVLFLITTGLYCTSNISDSLQSITWQESYDSTRACIAGQRFRESLSYAMKAADLALTEKGVSDTNYARSLNYVGESYYHLGKFDSSLIYYKQSLEKFEGIFKEDNEELSAILTNIGYIFHLSGKFAEAEMYFTKSLEMNKKLFSKDDLNLAQSYNNIAFFYKETGHL
jgi:tetratricopeptide (TPR) repeat protein